MNPSLFRSGCVLSLLLAFLAAAPRHLHAQELRASFPLPQVHALPTPEPGTEVQHVYYDVGSDRIRDSQLEPWGRSAFGAEVCFDNSELSGDPDTQTSHWVTPFPGEELVCWGTKQCRGSGLVRSITIAFGSNAEAGAISFALYEGTRGFGVLGHEVFRRTIRGVPLNHGHTPMLLTLEFGLEPLRLQDGDVGWGFLQLDGLTGPFLVRPDPSLGIIDAMDLYSIGPASTSEYRGTFNYGPNSCREPFFSLCASQWIQIEEVPVELVATSAIVNGSGVNPVQLHETLPARLGQLWAARLVAFDPTDRPLPSTLFLSSAASAPVPGPSGELLIDLGQLIGRPRRASPSGGYTVAIPPDVALAGRQVHVQGLVDEGTRSYLTNALRVTVGY